MTIKVAIVGVGNCASALVQGVAAYQERAITNMGLMLDDIGGYTPDDIQFVAAYDVDERKIGKLLNSAIYQKPNNCFDIFNVNDEKFDKNYPFVDRGPLIDGVADHMFADSESDSERFYVKSTTSNGLDYYVSKLKERNVDVLLNYLPVGSDEATAFWANVCLAAKVNMVNCIPSFIASNKEWSKKFAENDVAIIGDDMRSQIGASIISAALHELFLKRGATIDIHYQDNVGGNSDFYNMQDQSRLSSKKISKENVIRKQNELAGVETKANSLAAGPAKYFPALKDNKRAHWLIKGTIFGGAPFEFTADLSCQDSPNSAGVVVDAIRLVQVAKEIGIVGPIVGPSAVTQKTPPKDMYTADARNECELLAKRKIPHGYIERADGKFVSTFVE